MNTISKATSENILAAKSAATLRRSSLLQRGNSVAMAPFSRLLRLGLAQFIYGQTIFLGVLGHLLERKKAAKSAATRRWSWLLSLSLVALAFCACQGPWSYWPEEKEEYRGVYTIAYVIDGRPVTGVCFQRLLALDETLSENFAYYDSASVTISGNFSGSDTTITLSPQSVKPNCFDGPSDMIAKRGKTYSFDAVMHWDSAGRAVTSHYTATASIPSVFSISHAYTPTVNGERRELFYGDTSLTLSYPNDMLTYNFVPEFDDAVRGVLVTIKYDNVNGGENVDNSINKMMSSFMDESILTYSPYDSVKQSDFMENFKFGDVNSIDTLFFMSFQIPLRSVDFYFYATDQGYVDFVNTTLASAEDPRIIPVTNVKGGNGFFSGVAVDTFNLYMGWSKEDDVEFYAAKGITSCRDTSWSTKACRDYLYTFCADSNYVASECYAPAVKVALEKNEVWDSLLPPEIDSTAKQEAYWDGMKRYCIANNFPASQSGCSLNYNDCEVSEALNSCKEVLWNWCADRGWPLKNSPQCGTALVSRYRLNNLNSDVLKQVVNTWCEENTDDPQCDYQK